MSSDRMEIARNFAWERIEENPNIIAAIVTGSTAHNDDVETSDIDIRLLVDDTAGMQPKYSGIHPGQDGIFLDVEYIPATKFGDPAEILRDPYLAGAVRDTASLFDGLLDVYLLH